MLIGPPGVVTINTRRRLELDGDALVVNGRATEYVRKARLEALRAAELLRAALTGAGESGLAGRLVVRPLLAVVGGRLLVSVAGRGDGGDDRQLVPILRGMPAALGAGGARGSARWRGAR